MLTILTRVPTNQVSVTYPLLRGNNEESPDKGNNEEKVKKTSGPWQCISFSFPHVVRDGTVSSASNTWLMI